LRPSINKTRSFGLKVERIESTKNTKRFILKTFLVPKRKVKTDAMKAEVQSAADFVAQLLRVRQQVNSLSENQLHSFRGSLTSVLLEKYNNHWYENNPRKGSAFRCIRINGETSEPLIEKAAINCGLTQLTIRRLLPAELTLWIDPNTVSYRIGENGSISVLYDGNRSSPSDLDSSGSETCCEISPEINKLVLEFHEKFNNSIITKPKRYSKNRQNISNSPPRNFYQSSFYHQSPSNNQYYQNKAF